MWIFSFNLFCPIFRLSAASQSLRWSLSKPNVKLGMKPQSTPTTTLPSQISSKISFNHHHRHSLWQIFCFYWLWHKQLLLEIKTRCVRLKISDLNDRVRSGKSFFDLRLCRENRLFNLYAAKTEATKIFLCLFFFMGSNSFANFHFLRFSTPAKRFAGYVRDVCCFGGLSQRTALDWPRISFCLLYSLNVLFVKAKRFKIKSFFLATGAAAGRERMSRHGLIKILELTFLFGIFRVFSIFSGA